MCESFWQCSTITSFICSPVNVINQYFVNNSVINQYYEETGEAEGLFYSMDNVVWFGGVNYGLRKRLSDRCVYIS